MSINNSKNEVIKEDVPLFENKIYKIKQLSNKVLNTIYVFYGKNGILDEKTVFEKKDYSKIKKEYNEIFSLSEWEEIKKDEPTIVFCNESIYPDDTIASIKIKIKTQLLASGIENALEEFYLFTKKIEKLSSVAVYQSLTQNSKISLTKVRLDQFIKNVETIDEGTTEKGTTEKGTTEKGKHLQVAEDKQLYTYDDIFEMNIDNKNYVINKPLGQKYFIMENEYPYICNPYDIESSEYDKFLEQNSAKTLSTLNNHLLLNSGEIINDSIYLCLAKDVLSYAKEKDLSDQLLLKIYYPFLYNKDINSLEDLNAKQDSLLNGNKKFVNENTEKLFDTIDMFYNVYYQRKSELQYQSKGIKFIKAILKPEFDTKIPLEVLFKIIHATKVNPLIKYNPSSRQENVYRLYADKTAIDGRKIPYLKKATIFKLMKTIGKVKSVSVYLETEDANTLNCEFDENGYITMTAEFLSLKDKEGINDLLKKIMNPIIQEVKTVMEQSGYKINLFESLDDNNIDIKLITYETNVVISKVFDIQPFTGCISSAFINETDRKKNDKISLRFKRVSNFSKFNSQEAFILEKAEQGLRGTEIIQELLANFPEDMTMEQAQELVRKVANELEVERGVRKTDIKIKDNPGFKTQINIDQETAILTVLTENINNLGYLNTLPIYLDTLIRLTQGKNLTNYPVDKIDNLCGLTDIVDITYPEFTSLAETSSIVEIDGDESIIFNDSEEPV